MTASLEIKPLPGNVYEADLVMVGFAMYAESRFSHLPFDAGRATAMAHEVLHRKDIIGYGAFDDDRLEGFCIGECGQLLAFSSAIVADEFLFYLSPDFRNAGAARELAKAFIEEARRRGAQDITFSNGTGFQPEKFDRFMETLGMSRIGGVYSFGG